MIIYYTVETIDGPKKLQAEIQIRTMAMNFWATVEHSLQYKYRGDMPPHVADRLSKAAEAIVSLDHEMSSVRSEIMDAQNSSQLQSNLVKDILTNIENLYKISNSREILKIQDEFLRVYQMKDLHQLARFHRELDIIAEGYHAQSVSQRSLS
jgi:putative GTP pyrophosphokinase